MIWWKLYGQYHTSYLDRISDFWKSFVHMLRFHIDPIDVFQVSLNYVISAIMEENIRIAYEGIAS